MNGNKIFMIRIIKLKKAWNNVLPTIPPEELFFTFGIDVHNKSNIWLPACGGNACMPNPLWIMQNYLMYHIYSEIEKNEATEFIYDSINRLIERDPELLAPIAIESSNISDAKELNRELHETTINHRLACHFEYFLDKYNMQSYHCDIEYNRYINNQKLVTSLQTGQLIEVRPDIIVHKRIKLYENIPHYLVVEAKKRKISDKDRNHVEDIMYDMNYKYKFGLLISYYNDPLNINCELIILENNNFIKESFKIEK
ncbi:MAG: hypothetical protein IPM92_00055 [Saprospiraceae bacterium]|nr:hypothetical protein [Saprospiraceae bacterium]